ncbi:MAG: DinB family protein [Niabella sp.]
MSNHTEVWLRGNKTPGLSPYLQPAADALWQAQEEIENMLTGFPENLIWVKPDGMATIAFHLKHICGVLDRLLTYASGHQLTDAQFLYLKEETVDKGETLNMLLLKLQERITNTINQYKNITDESLISPCLVGSKQLPSTVIGLCFHAAEHTMRHTGQLLVSVASLKKMRTGI